MSLSITKFFERTSLMNDITYLPSILILLAASILVVVSLYKLKISPVLGYLIAGAAISHLGLIKETEYAHQLAEFGVVFLLFMIGLELSFDRLIKMKLQVFGFGGLQVIITSSVITFVLNKFFHFPISVSVVIGAALALSSTAIVLQILSESGRQSSQVGRLSLAMLLMQDFAVVPLLAVLPLLTAGHHEDVMHMIGLAGLKALAVIFAITIFGRLFLRPFFSLIASVKTDEVYVTTALLIVLGTAWITNELGLSSAMGAFIAGILIAETEYRNQIENSIHPFQGLFLGLFFLSVGMSIDIDFMLNKFRSIVLAGFALLSLKAVIILVLCKIFRLRWGAALHSSLLLAQGGEFALILLSLAASKGIISMDTSKFMLMVVAVSMAVTPLLSILGSWIEDKFDSEEELDNNKEFKGISDLDDHVIIAGFGRVGKIVAYMLEREQINYIAVESNTDVVKKAKQKGYPVFHGEISDDGTLQALGIKRAKAVILTMSEKITLRKSTKKIFLNYKNVRIISRAEDYKHSKDIRKLGAENAIPERIEVGLQLGGVALQNLDSPKHNVLAIKEEIRRNNYSKIEENELFKY
ncbi:cation:proton antiporter domain-containing protein [Candidatus Bandiella euplotis]|uniref:Potassium transporter n=1 Tax=Candidatus Bandiella euplotis TaxID=1664265 RepID=A0ABZ0UN47_9RICK|nr:cation:proton antiporter [Candidatus Bandiella woodruffii]WPX97362.1 Putative potassium transporter [Candidatus Bandiella woodruffii]